MSWMLARVGASWPWLAVGIHWLDLASVPGEERAVLRLSGPDTTRFLQGTLSADVEALRADEGRPAALLTVKGKIVSDAVVVRLGEVDLGLLVPAALAREIVALLQRHLVMDEVAVTCERLCVALAWGERADRLAGAGVLALTSTHPAPGRLLLGEASAVRAVLPAAAEAGPAAWALHRIETASPGWGHEIEAGRFPPEVGFAAAVSYDKGCFMGQEPLARIHARGQVNWVMVRLEARRAPDPAQVGAVPLSHAEREDAGRWTTWADDGARVRGLAIVRRGLAVPGTVLEAAGLGRVQVESGPLGDDAGVRR